MPCKSMKTNDRLTSPVTPRSLFPVARYACPKTKNALGKECVFCWYRPGESNP